MKFNTINPVTEEVIAEYTRISSDELLNHANNANSAFSVWRMIALKERISYINNVADILNSDKRLYAEMITKEMGKPIKQAIAEVEKCAFTASVYTDNVEEWLEGDNISADGKSHMVRYEPLGTILAIMPWNFPFWQVFRFALPTLLSGNTVILKHADSVSGCAELIEDIFKKSGLSDHIFKTVITGHKELKTLIESGLVQGVSLTGSTGAGESVARIAGGALKKCVLELGGSDPFIVCEDADIDFAAKNAVTGRTINSGQSCIAAKRFIVNEVVAYDFSNKFSEMMKKLKIGDPMEADTDIGPLANIKQVEILEGQVKDAIAKGAVLLAGGGRLDRKGYFYKPTLLGNITTDMRVFKEEVFGPVAPIIIVKDDDEAVTVANSTEFGLGASIWTKDEGRGMKIAERIESGTVFINSTVKSDPRIPFGGVKKSGIGRELSKYGLIEFTNIKSYNIY